MTSEHWLYRATMAIRFPSDREAVRRELRDHLEDRVEAYMEQGRARPEAEEAAVEAMGDPDAISEELGRIHSPWWGYFWRVSRVVLVLVVIFVALGVIPYWNDIFYYSRPELPEGDTYVTQFEVEWSVLEKWHPAGSKELGGYRFRVPMAWVMTREYDSQTEAGELVRESAFYLMVCLRADTWRFWEPASFSQYMVLENVVLDGAGVYYAWREPESGWRSLFCETWQEPLTTWYLVWLDLPGPEDVPDWVDIPVGYGGGSVRVDLTAEVVS